MSRFEKIAPPTQLLAELRGLASAADERALRADIEADARKEKAKRGAIALGVAFVSMFLVPILAEATGVDAVGLVGLPLVFGGMGYGAIMLIKGLGNRLALPEAPPDDRRYVVAADMLEALIPDLADAEATMWVVTDPVSGALVTHNERKPDGKRITRRAVQWLQLEARAGDGATWTLGATITRQEKMKTRPGKVKTKIDHQEKVSVTVQTKAELPEGLVAGMQRLGAAKGMLQPGLRVARARARGRKAQLEVALETSVRDARISEARAALGFMAGMRAPEQAWVEAMEILCVAAVMGRLRG